MPRQHFYKPPGLIALGFRDLRATVSELYGAMDEKKNRINRQNQEKNTVYQDKLKMQLGPS